MGQVDTGGNACGDGGVDTVVKLGLEEGKVVGGRLRAGGVSACLSNAWDDFRGDPFAEWAGLWLIAAEDQGIHAGLGNDVRFLGSAHGIDEVNLIDLIVIEWAQGHGDVSQSEGSANVLGDKPRRSGPIGDAQEVIAKGEGLSGDDVGV